MSSSMAPGEVGGPVAGGLGEFFPIAFPPWGQGKGTCSFAALAAGAAAATSGAVANLRCPTPSIPRHPHAGTTGGTGRWLGRSRDPVKYRAKPLFQTGADFSPPPRMFRVAFCSGARKYCSMVVGNDQPCSHLEAADIKINLTSTSECRKTLQRTLNLWFVWEVITGIWGSCFTVW